MKNQVGSVLFGSVTGVTSLAHFPMPALDLTPELRTLVRPPLSHFSTRFQGKGRYERSWGHHFQSFEEFLAFSWPVIIVTDAWTGRAHIVTRLNSIGAFLKMIKTRYFSFLSFPSRQKKNSYALFLPCQIRRNPPTSTQHPPSNPLRKHKPPPPQRLRLPILQKTTLNAASCRPCRVENPGTHWGAQGHPGAMG